MDSHEPETATRTYTEDDLNRAYVRGFLHGAFEWGEPGTRSEIAEIARNSAPGPEGMIEPFSWEKSS